MSSVKLVAERERNTRAVPFIIITSFKHASEPSTRASRRDTALANGFEQHSSSWLCPSHFYTICTPLICWVNSGVKRLVSRQTAAARSRSRFKGEHFPSPQLRASSRGWQLIPARPESFLKTLAALSEARHAADCDVWPATCSRWDTVHFMCQPPVCISVRHTCTTTHRLFCVVLK